MNQERTPEARRIVQQRLESLMRAGLTHLPVAEEPAETTPPQAETPPSRSDGQTSGTQETVEPQSDTPTVVPESPPSAREQREAALAEVARRVAACQRCPELARTRTQTVFGVGNPEARLMFVGEAPGADEDRLGEPFVGRAGQLLNRIIAACRMKREDVYICNILRCRPPENRNPTPEEARNCREYLDAQIRIVDPEYIVCLGSVAAQNLLDTTDSVGRLRGRFIEYGRARVACTYHPSYLLRTPSAKKKTWDDMKMVMRAMGVEL